MKKILFFILLLSAVFTASSQSIYKTPGGKKYHLESCRMVKNVSEKITIEQAAELGLDPCSICRPPAANLLYSGTNKAKGKNTTVQCMGITKKGNRCKHMTSIADGFCY